MLIETLFLRLFEPDQSEIKQIVQEIVNIHNGAIFKNGTIVFLLSNIGYSKFNKNEIFVFAIQQGLKTTHLNDAAIRLRTTALFFNLFLHCSTFSTDCCNDNFCSLQNQFRTNWTLMESEVIFFSVFTMNFCSKLKVLYADEN